MEKMLLISQADLKLLLEKAFESGKTFDDFDNWFESINETVNEIPYQDVLNEDDLNVMFDIMYEVFDVCMTEKRLNEYFQVLPKDIKNEIEWWGLRNNETKNKVKEFFKQAYNK